MDVIKIRSQIPVCSNLTYLNTGWSGPSPEPVLDAIKARIDYESAEGPVSKPVLESGHEIEDGTRQAVAGLLNVAPDELALTQNTTEGLNMVMSGFPWQEGDEIITFDIEHLSVMIPCLYAARRHGVKVRVVELGTNDEWDRILSKVEAQMSPRTRMIAFSHIQFSCGLRMPLEGIRSLTKDKGIYMLVDGAQTPGHITLDLSGMGVDFYSTPGHKWMLGPEGTGALFIRRDHIEMINPSYVGHSAVDTEKKPLEFDLSGMNKFKVSTTSAALAAGYGAAIGFINEAGPAEIEARNIALSSYLKAKLLERGGYDVLSPLEGPGLCGLTSFRAEGATSQEIVDRLWEDHRIVARSVGGVDCVRISSDFYNTEEELDRFMDALQAIVA